MADCPLALILAGHLFDISNFVIGAPLDLFAGFIFDGFGEISPFFTRDYIDASSFDQRNGGLKNMTAIVAERLVGCDAGLLFAAVALLALRADVW